MIMILFKPLKHFLILLAIILYCNNGYAQVIKGTVFDKSTNDPIPFATVYYSRTTYGTVSDQNGRFEIKIPKGSSMPLIFSSLGYYSSAVTEFSADKQYSVYLTPKVYELDEVIITAETDTRARKSKLRIFKREFLGRTINARHCEIINTDDIILVYSSGKDTLTAFSNAPVKIYNEALGYYIEFFMDKFEFCMINNRLALIGNYIFRSDTLASEEQLSEFEEKRKRAYLGSRMHFFRALWNNQLEPEGFTVRDESGAELSYDELVYIKDSLQKGKPEKYLKYSDTVLVYYRRNIFRILYGSFVMADDHEYVYFEKNGYFYTPGLIWEDSIMARARIADLLPFNYKPKEKKNL